MASGVRCVANVAPISLGVRLLSTADRLGSLYQESANSAGYLRACAKSALQDVRELRAADPDAVLAVAAPPDFMTKRPPSAGDSVQFQTQWWIERVGFYLPAVLQGGLEEFVNALQSEEKRQKLESFA